MEDGDLEKRAVAAWYRVEGTECAIKPKRARVVPYRDPKWGVLKHVVLEGETSTLAVYRVRNDDKLKRLRHFPDWVDPASPNASGEQIYVIGAQRSNKVKIGVTDNPDRQLSVMQVGNSRPLRIVHTHPGGRDLEGRLHRYFQLFRTPLGWFDFGAANAKVLVERAIVEVGG